MITCATCGREMQPGDILCCPKPMRWCNACSCFHPGRDCPYETPAGGELDGSGTNTPEPRRSQGLDELVNLVEDALKLGRVVDDQLVTWGQLLKFIDEASRKTA